MYVPILIWDDSTINVTSDGVCHYSEGLTKFTFIFIFIFSVSGSGGECEVCGHSTGIFELWHCIEANRRSR